MKKLITIILVSIVLFSCKKEAAIQKQPSTSTWNINGQNQGGTALYVNDNSENIIFAVNDISSVGIHFKLQNKVVAGNYIVVKNTDNLSDKECYLYSLNAGYSVGKQGDIITVSFDNNYMIASFNNIFCTLGTISGVIKQ